RSTSRGHLSPRGSAAHHPEDQGSVEKFARPWRQHAAHHPGRDPMSRSFAALAALAGILSSFAPAAVPTILAAQEAPPAAQQAALPAASTILRVIRERVDAGRNKGIVVGVLGPDGRTRVVAYGDPGAGQPPLDGNSVFE